MLIFRYLAKEISTALVSLTAVLILIFMSNQLIIYLNRAANGQIPGVIVLKIILLELPNLLGLLLPLGLYVAILLGLGRLYVDQEMTVLKACGYSPNRLLGHVMTLALVVATVVALIIFWLSPYVAVERAKILRETGVKTLVQTLIPGKFQTLLEGNQVLFVEKIKKNHESANNIFLARIFLKDNAKFWDVILAKQARLVTNAKGSEYIHLEDGRFYEGSAGHCQLRMAHFEDYEALVKHPKISIASDIRTIPSKILIQQAFADNAKLVELEWRISVPIMVFMLAFLAIPLSKIEPRQKKSMHLFLALIIYFVYANMMFVNRGWLLSGTLPVWLGFWWLHGLIFLVASIIWWRYLKVIG